MKRAAWPGAVALALCAALCPPPGLAQAAGDQDHAPPKSVTVKIVTNAPDPKKWNVGKTADGTKRVFSCKPLACAAPETVVFSFRKGQMTPPAADWLETYATVELPKTIRAAAASRAVMTGQSEKIETLFSKTATLKDYPSALNETKITQGLAVVYVELAIIFAGPIIVQIESKSPSRDLAKNSLQGFVQELQIVETPGPPPGTAGPARPRAPKTQEL
jgi:hypothetical protein